MRHRHRRSAFLRHLGFTVVYAMAIVGACKILSFAADNASSPVLTVERSTNGPAQILLTTAPNQTNILETSISMRAWFPVLVYPATNRVVTFQLAVTNDANLPRAFYRVVNAPTASSAPPVGFTNYAEAFSSLMASTVAMVEATPPTQQVAGLLFQASQSAAMAAARTEFQRSNQNNYAGL